MSAEQIHYRTATEADIGAMALVLARANAVRDGQPAPSMVDDPELSDDLYLRMHRDGAWTYVADDQPATAGFMLGYPYPEDLPDVSAATREYLSLLMVDPDHWGRGIASRLLDIAADTARQHNSQQLLLWTRLHDNKHARGVYEHKGYHITGQTRNSRAGHGLQLQYTLDL